MKPIESREGTHPADTERTEEVRTEEVRTVERTDERGGYTRRSVLQGGAGALAMAGAGSLLPDFAFAASGGSHTVYGPSRSTRRQLAFDLRVDAATYYLTAPDSGVAVQPVNGDEGRYADCRASFSKTLDHDSIGEVVPSSYQSYLTALDTGHPDDFEAIQVGNPADPNRVRLVSPQAAYAFELFGFDGNDPRIAAAPRFDSAETSAEMGELYWYALTRDIPFIDYGTNADIFTASLDLNNFSRSDIFPQISGRVTPGSIFRGTFDGATTGPFVSQFLVQPFQLGRLDVDALYTEPRSGSVNDYLTDFATWLAIQNGAPPAFGTSFTTNRRYLYNMRTLSEFVHVDYPIQSGLYAAAILFGYGDAALSPNNPYLRTASTTQQGFVDFGLADITHLITHGPRLGLTGAWYQKWLAHRRLRPEVFGARINIDQRGIKTYDFNREVLNSEAYSRIAAQASSPNDVGLLPIAYPEGSPAHPAYPGGHSSFVAAAATILKAFFNEDFVIPNPVQPNADGTALVPWTGADLTVGGELNKLVGNITHARDGAGMHYRSDGRGNFVGERQALGILLDYSRTYNERFDGFELTLFDETPIRIQNGQIFDNSPPPPPPRP